MTRLLCVLAGATALGGCITPREVADPNDISLGKAVMDVADSLHAVRAKYANQPKIGLGVASATVVFNIASKSTDQGQLKIDVAAGESVGFPLSGMFQRTLTNEGSRGNTITIEFAPSSAKGGAGPVIMKKKARTSADQNGKPAAAAANPPAATGGASGSRTVTDQLFDTKIKLQSLIKEYDELLKQAPSGPTR